MIPLQSGWRIISRPPASGIGTAPPLPSRRRREFIDELRADSRSDAINPYNHIDMMEPEEAYLVWVLQLRR